MSVSGSTSFDSKRPIGAWRWVVGLGFAVFGVLAVGDWASWKWVAITLALYSIPTLGQLFRSGLVRSYSLWFGVMLVAQTFLTSDPLDNSQDDENSVITFQPNMSLQRDIVGSALPGLGGLQSFTTDSKGFRVTKSINYEAKPPDTYRIFAVGASTTAQDLLDEGVGCPEH